jgi:hypothetical protein
MVERLRGTTRQRNKVMRGLDDVETAQTMMDGLRIYYNFMRPHTALNGKTPSEVSRIAETNERTWESLIEKSAMNARKL